MPHRRLAPPQGEEGQEVSPPGYWRRIPCAAFFFALPAPRDVRLVGVGSVVLESINIVIQIGSEDNFFTGTKALSLFEETLPVSRPACAACRTPT